MPIFANDCFPARAGALLACFLVWGSASRASETEAGKATPTTNFTFEVKMEGLIGFVREGAGTPRDPRTLRALFVNATGDDQPRSPINKECCKTSRCDSPKEDRRDCNPPPHISGARVESKYVREAAGSFVFLPFRDGPRNEVSRVAFEGLKYCSKASVGIEDSDFDHVPKLSSFRLNGNSKFGKTKDNILADYVGLSAHASFDRGVLATTPNKMTVRSASGETKESIFQYTFECPCKRNRCRPRIGGRRSDCSWKNAKVPIAKIAVLTMECRRDPNEAPAVVLQNPDGIEIDSIDLKPDADSKIKVELLNLLPADIVGRPTAPRGQSDMSHTKWLYHLTEPRTGLQDYIIPVRTGPMISPPASKAGETDLGPHVLGGWPVCALVELEAPASWIDETAK